MSSPLNKGGDPCNGNLFSEMLPDGDTSSSQNGLQQVKVEIIDDDDYMVIKPCSRQAEASEESSSTTDVESDSTDLSHDVVLPSQGQHATDSVSLDKSTESRRYPSEQHPGALPECSGANDQETTEVGMEQDPNDTVISKDEEGQPVKTETGISLINNVSHVAQTETFQEASHQGNGNTKRRRNPGEVKGGPGLCTSSISHDNSLWTEENLHQEGGLYTFPKDSSGVLVGCFQNQELKKLFTAKKIHQCDICNRKFASKTSTQVHLLTHTDERPHSCGICGKRFPRKCDVKLHSASHAKPKPYPCDLCGKRFSRKGDLKSHNVIHSGDRPYKCDVCDKSFYRRGGLQAHFMIHTGEKPYKCDTCGKGFIWKGHLNTHCLIHTSEGPHRCDICGKRFYRKDSLKLHVMSHTGDRPYKCVACDKSFLRQCELDAHFLTHTGKKCEVCDKLFYGKFTFMSHFLTHQPGEKPHKCNVCGKSFFKRCDLNAHHAIHTGKISQMCHVCGKGFYRKSDLNKHFAIHKDERPHKCDVCNKCFMRKSYLKQHLSTHMRKSR